MSARRSPGSISPRDRMRLTRTLSAPPTVPVGFRKTTLMNINYGSCPVREASLGRTVRPASPYLGPLGGQRSSVGDSIRPEKAWEPLGRGELSRDRTPRDDRLRVLKAEHAVLCTGLCRCNQRNRCP